MSRISKYSQLFILRTHNWSINDKIASLCAVQSTRRHCHSVGSLLWLHPSQGVVPHYQSHFLELFRFPRKKYLHPTHTVLYYSFIKHILLLRVTECLGLNQLLCWMSYGFNSITCHGHQTNLNWVLAPVEGISTKVKQQQRFEETFL